MLYIYRTVFSYWLSTAQFFKHFFTHPFQTIMLSNKFFPKLAGSKQPEVRYAPVDRASFLPYKENSASVSSDGESLSAGDTIKEDYNISYGVTKTRLCFYLLVATVLGISLGVLGCQVTWDKRAFSPKSRVKEFAPESMLSQSKTWRSTKIYVWLKRDHG